MDREFQGGIFQKMQLVKYKNVVKKLAKTFAAIYKNQDCKSCLESGKPSLIGKYEKKGLAQNTPF